MTRKKRNIPVDLVALQQAGTQKRTEAHAEREITKMGILRGGNAAMLLPDGNVAGDCHRKTLARSLGIAVDDADAETQLMFSAGIHNENIWAEDLATWTGSLLRETEIPVHHVLSNGTEITGRPDIVLTETDGTLVMGLELKLSSAWWSAYNVSVKQQPKFAHLCQAGLYSLLLGQLPYALAYASRTNFTGPEWFFDVPKKGERGSEYFEYTPLKMTPDGVYTRGKNKGKTRWKKEKVDIPYEDKKLSDEELKKKYGANSWQWKYLRPFVSIYYISWEDDTLLFCHASDPNNWIYSPITKEGLLGYYQYVSEMKAKKELGPRPIVLEADGELSTYTECSFCPLRTACDKAEKDKEVADYDTWEAEVRKLK